jgi:hypothetical protein
MQLGRLEHELLRFHRNVEAGTAGTWKCQACCSRRERAQQMDASSTHFDRRRRNDWRRLRLQPVALAIPCGPSTSGATATSNDFGGQRSSGIKLGVRHDF